MQQLRRTVHHAAVRDRHRLHPQADTEDRNAAPRAVMHHVDADARLFGRAGTGRQQDAVEAVLGVPRGHLVVAHDLALGTELVEVLDEVEDKAVVVVDDENACAH